MCPPRRPDLLNPEPMQIALYEPGIAQTIVTILRLAACVTFAARAIDSTG